ncbi:MAG: iron-sulfur cluster assembly scaffold protein [Candidatus Eisenbacteria sp.]|nr:iron-sulfur cluster assembly scaffold protein [Candidatus Eisenbacteria bacterium]
MSPGSKSDDLDAFAEEFQRLFLEEAIKIYGERVVDLWRKPRNMVPLERPDGSARITGPCGDTMECFLEIEKGRITRATFVTNGCGPSIASGGAVTELAKGKTLEEALKIDQANVLDALGGLPGESAHCAKLAAMTLTEAVRDHLRQKD